MILTGLSLQYPTWMIFLAFLVGLAYAVGLYYKDQHFGENNKQKTRLLGLTRFLLVFFLALLLLKPVIKSLETFTKKPYLLFLQDDSQSIGSSLGDVEAGKYQAEVQSLVKNLSDQYEVRQYAFGGNLRETKEFGFSEKATNMSMAFQQVYDQYGNQHVGPIILATDGIYNQGSNPLYQADRLAAPVYAIALGDTTTRKDLILKSVFYNQIVYLGDRFTIQADVQAKNCEGQQSRLTVHQVLSDGDRKLIERPITITSNNWFSTEELILDAATTGVARYRISLSPLQGEAIKVNNTRDIFLDVLDARQKILILANAPHPDISALYQSITGNRNYEVTIGYAADWEGNLADYDLVILHQLPSTLHPLAALQAEMDKLNIPRFYLVGMQSDLAALNKRQNLVTISGDGSSSNDVQAAIAESFSLFNLSKDLGKMIPLFTPLLAPFGDFQEGPEGQVLLYQKIGKIETKYPLLVLGEEKGVKTAVWAAENIWKWRLFDYLQHDNHLLFDELIAQLTQYLSLQEDKRRFRISINDPIIPESEPVLFNAALYNESYELVNDPEVRMSVLNAEGKEYTYTFNRQDRTYRLNAGFFPPGDYRFEGQVMYSGKQQIYQGQFSVQPIQLEAYETTANHNLLDLLVEKYGGKKFYPGSLTELEAAILERNDKPVIYQSETTRSIIHLKELFFLLFSLLTLEWGLRRYYGSY